MRQLPKSAAPHQRVRVGHYVARQLRLGGFDEWAATVAAAALLVRDAARAWEDEDALAYGASAERDRADHQLDDTTSNTRVALAGRHKHANKEAPYTLIYPDGIAFYVQAPHSEQVARYGLLSQRLRTFLPENDPLRAVADLIDQGLEAYQAGVNTLNLAQQKLTLAAQRLAEAEAAFDATLEKIFGLLVTHFESRAQASALFPS